MLVKKKTVFTESICFGDLKSLKCDTENASINRVFFISCRISSHRFAAKNDITDHKYCRTRKLIASCSTLNRLSKFEISVIFCQTGIWTVQSEVSLLVLWQTTQILLIGHKSCVLKCCFETTLSYTKLSSFTFLLIYLFWKLNAVFWRPNSLSIALREVFFLCFQRKHYFLLLSCIY